MDQSQRPCITVDQNEALTSLVMLGLVEMLFTDAGPRYRIVEHFAGPNELLRARQRRKSV